MSVTIRTCYFYKDAGGAIRFLEWAKVQTNDMGTLIQPFFPNQRNEIGSVTDMSAVDYDEEECRIDRILEIEEGKRWMILTDTADPIACFSGDMSLA